MGAAAGHARRERIFILDYVLIAAGLVGLFVGGEMLVRGSIGIALRLAIPPLLVGLTVVGFGTSMPEMLVSVDAALRGVPDIAIGNVVGSNIANILLIIGLSALVWPITVAGNTLRRDTGVMMAAALSLVPLFFLGEIGRIAGLALVAALGIYLVWAYRTSSPDEAPETQAAPTSLVVSIALALGGLVALVFGARFLVDGAVSIARSWGLSEAFIGLTIVAVGTSLPELATSLVAAIRRHSEIAIGNIVGSNIFNVFAILGITAIVTPIPVAGRFLTFDLPVMLAVSLVLTFLLLTRPVIGRVAGAVLLIAYMTYIFMSQG
jgi:cation:H+ antiporter